jgi:NTP pyrophosphatase (non-canonical NTP hydrolase)
MLKCPDLEKFFNESLIMAMDNLIILRDRLRGFAENRDWSQFHTPKNLAMALSVEAAEVVELFQWLTPEESVGLPNHKFYKAREELSDVLIYLVMLADRLGIDLSVAANEKISENEIKYPVQKSRGRADKYLDLE